MRPVQLVTGEDGTLVREAQVLRLKALPEVIVLHTTRYFVLQPTTADDEVPRYRECFALTLTEETG